MMARTCTGGAVATAADGRSSSPRCHRRLSLPLPDYSNLIIPMKPKVENNKGNKKSSSQPYEFEKVQNQQPVDTVEDMAIQFQFKPKREYLPGQRTRPAVDIKTKTKTTTTIIIGRRSLPIIVQSSERRRLVVVEKLSVFERQRKKHQMEEGALYRASHTTTEKEASRSSLQKEEEEEEEEERKKKQLLLLQGGDGKFQQRRQSSSLMDLLEKDANKYNSNLSLFYELSGSVDNDDDDDDKSRLETTKQMLFGGNKKNRRRQSLPSDTTTTTNIIKARGVGKSRRASMLDISCYSSSSKDDVTKGGRGGFYYDWANKASAKKQKENSAAAAINSSSSNNSSHGGSSRVSSKWEHIIKSDANAVRRRSPEEIIMPLKPNNNEYDYGKKNGNNCLLPKLKVLLPLVRQQPTKLRKEIHW